MATGPLAAQLQDAAALIQGGQAATALANLQAVLRTHGTAADAHYLAGLAYAQLGSRIEAVAALERALSLNPMQPLYAFQLGMVWDAGGETARAAAAYAAAIKAAPHFAEAHYNLGLACQTLGQTESAIASYRQALAERPDFVEALNNLGNLLTARGEAQSSLQLLQRAIALRPGFAVPYNNLGHALAKLGQREEAIQVLRKAAVLAPEFHEAWLNLGQQLHLAGHDGEAVKAYQQALALRPDDANTRFALAALEGERPAAPPDAFVRQVFDELAQRFDQHLVGHLGYAIPGLLRETLKPWLADRRNLRVLDLGCGTGLFGVEIADWAAQLSGVDLSGEMLAKARARAIYHQLVEGELGQYLASQADASADLVAATDVLVYVGALEGLFAQVARVLAPGGQFGFSVERCEGDSFQLQPTSRYAHSGAYVEALAQTHGMQVLHLIDTPIRSERGVPIPGYLFVLG